MQNSEILARMTGEIGVGAHQVLAVEKLLNDGCTVPFIARYRKEAHGNLDEVQIGKIQERLAYYTELEQRKETILKTIDEQGKLTDELRDKIVGCFVKTALEDLYQPYKPKRRTRAQVAKEKGYEPLADKIWNGEPFDGTEEDLQYARDILAERIADIADVRGAVRQAYATRAVVKSEVVSPKPTEPTKFEQYYDFSESIATIPSHRYLALRRGQTEKVLWVKLELDKEPVIGRIVEILQRDLAGRSVPGRRDPRADGQIALAAEDAYKRLLAPSCEIDVTVDKKLDADRAAVEVFAENLRHLLLASPLGEKAVLAIDPGIRTGCKVAMLDSTGKYLGKTVIFPQQKPLEAAKAIALIVAKYHAEAVAVGNGTAGRETETFVRDTLKKLKAQHPKIPTPIVVSVSEAGASVYSASEIARKEFPDLDLTVRGAISIGRRLQDPLAELVKVEPKAIGVGQYQHDVQQSLLEKKLDEVVVSCVNGVGVELNTASAPLLERVSGLTPALAKSIVEWRDANGKFSSREELKKIKGLGPKAFEQCAGFLRIRGAKNPLDSSAVHPERYAIVERMASDAGLDLSSLVGNAAVAKKIDIRKYISNDIGEPTLKDIVAELAKPGRDPRTAFEPPKFRDDVTKIEDVREGMKLEGVVTNVTAFGAFVDIGVHQDGLIHLSELSDNYVSDAASIVKAGDRLQVTVIGVDLARGRISLSAKSKPTIGMPAPGAPRKSSAPRSRDGTFSIGGNGGGFRNNAFASLGKLGAIALMLLGGSVFAKPVDCAEESAFAVFAAEGEKGADETAKALQSLVAQREGFACRPVKTVFLPASREAAVTVLNDYGASIRRDSEVKRVAALATPAVHAVVTNVYAYDFRTPDDGRSYPLGLSRHADVLEFTLGNKIDDRVLEFVCGAFVDDAKPLCQFENGDGPITAAEAVEAMETGSWLDDEIAKTKKRIDLWRGNDEVVLVAFECDLHFFSPVRGRWQRRSDLTEGRIRNVKRFAYIANRFGADLAADLGDLGYDYSGRYWKRACKGERAARLAVQSAVYDLIKVPFFAVPGNHDEHWSSPSGFGDFFNPPCERNSRFVVGATRSYGYIDLVEKRTRVFMVNTSEHGNGGHWEISAEQVAFMQKAVAATPAGWTAVFFSHDCLHRTAGNRDWKERPVCKASRTYCDMRSLLEETAAGGRLKLAGIYCGDSHMNRLHEEKGVKYFICDAAFHARGEKGILVHVAAIRPSTGEARLFRIGTGGQAGDM